MEGRGNKSSIILGYLEDKIFVVADHQCIQALIKLQEKINFRYKACKTELLYN